MRTERRLRTEMTARSGTIAALETLDFLKGV